MRIKVETIKVKISDDIAVPPVVHDRCDVSLLDVSVACKLKDSALECALSDCGGEKFKCDCNVYEFVFDLTLFMIECEFLR